MAKGVLLFREDSQYKDRPWEVYQFPTKLYLSRAAQLIGDWVIFMQPVKAGKRGYHAVAKVEKIVSDPQNSSMHLALIEPTSYLEFDRDVPFQTMGAYPEESVLNDAGKVSGRAQAAVRTIPDVDFNRIISLGIFADETLLPRTGPDLSAVAEDQMAYKYEQDRGKQLALRAIRDRVFRRKVLRAYENRCAFTGFQFINGGGRAEVEAAHIKSVEMKGPDVVQNGIALSGTVHWMFDRGLISLTDDSRIILSNHINDLEGVRRILISNGIALLPGNAAHRPDPAFLSWHRGNCFKGSPIT